MRKVLIFIMLTTPLWAGVLTQDFTYSNEDIILKGYDQYMLIEMKGADVYSREGEPVLPHFIHHFVIPPSAEVINVEIIEEDIEYLPGTYLAYPGQTPRPFSVKTEIPFVNPKAEIYNSSQLYPDHSFEYSQTGSKHGWRVCVVTLYPLRYTPNKGKLQLARNITVKITYQEGIHPVETITERQHDVFTRAVRGLVSNPEDVDQWTPNIRPNSINDINYAIVTSETHINDFNTLKEWKTKKGYMTDVFSTTWIYSQYNGDDNQEDIRLFLRDYYQNKGLIWVILAGDYNIVPDRDIYSTFNSPYYIACDWYYCDLDSNWNRNGNSLYGELGDVIPPNCYFEVYVGRAPIDNVTQINDFISKSTIFDKNPPTSGIEKILLPSVQMFSNWHGRITNNFIGAMFPGDWTLIKIEDSQAHAPNPRNQINSNHPQFTHVMGHGDTYGTYTQYGTPIFTNSDVPSLTNNLPFIIGTVACYPGNFDGPDCFAEQLMNKASPSGAIGVLMNCRYGFGYTSAMGPSEELDTTFFHALCRKDTFWLGIANAVCKEHNRNRIWGQGVWHYCGTELNLFGDPELYMFLDTPGNLYLSFPSPIPTGAQNFTVTVTDSKAPVEDALVCTYKDGEVHETGRTDASGQVTLSIDPQTEGMMYVTGSAFNFLPTEDTCDVAVGVAEGHSDIAKAGIWVNPTLVRDRITINYAVSAARELKVTLYNSIGARVAQIYRGTVSGEGSIKWDAKYLPAGVYFVNVEHESSETKQILLIR